MVTAEQLEAAQEATGNEELELSEVSAAVACHAGEKLADMKKKLRSLERRFESAGGRGVELADDIDRLRIAIAARGNTPDEVTNWCDFDKSEGQTNACRFSALLNDVAYNVRVLVDNEKDGDQRIRKNGKITAEAWARAVAAGLVNE